LESNVELRSSELDLLKNQDQQVSGVNMDEELSKMIQYQQGYQGAAKIMQSAQLMYQSLMSILG
jgi:flagellar hook-associated protein 1 FlgK